MQHVMTWQDSHEHLLERILSSDNRHRAWKQVKKNKGAAGVDGMSIDEMPAYLREHWRGIRESLMEGRYQPSPVLRVEIPKPTGGVRLLGIPTVLDRVIQQAIAQVLTEICDPDFSECSYGFRPGRSAHDAVYQAREVHHHEIHGGCRHGPGEIFRYGQPRCVDGASRPENP